MRLPQKLSFPVDAVAKQVMGKDWQLYAGLLEHWEEIVGADYARCTTPVKITFPHALPGNLMASGKRGDGTLHIRLPQGLVMEFTYQTERIKQRITAYFGYPAVSRITYEPVYGQKATAPSTPYPILEYRDNRLAELDNDDLAQALRQFGGQVMAQGNKITG